MWGEVTYLSFYDREREEWEAPAGETGLQSPAATNHIAFFMRLNLRSLRRASACLRRFFTLGFS